MGRFEKQPDNPRVRGDLSRAAENALWAVVEDLENLQQHVLRSLQEEVKRLQGEKNRLSDDINQLLDEKEQLQQARQISEQQVLIRQLAEALAKHISSQLQSSLTTLANQSQSIEKNSSARQALAEGKNNENVEQMLGSLDDSLTITFNSLQQELKNYQSNLSQQLSRMHGQQQQGELIIAELINRLQELEKTIAKTPLKATQVSPPTVLQLPEQQAVISPTTVLQLPQQQQIAWQSSPDSQQMSSQAAVESSENKTTSQSETFATPLEATVLPAKENVTEPISVLSPELSESETTPEPSLLSAPVTLTAFSSNDSEPISVLSSELSESETTPEPSLASTEATSTAFSSNDSEPISVLSSELSESETTPEPSLASTEATSTAFSSNDSEPISVLSPELSESETTSEPSLPSTEVTSTAFSSNNSETISVLSPELSESETAPEPSFELPKATPPPASPNQPISVISNDLSASKTKSEPVLPSPKQRVAPPSLPLPGSSTLSSIQIGFLLIVLSTVVSSLYNVAIKVIFQQGAEILGVQVERLLLPTLGNVLLILMLRLLVVVPLMLMLAPMMHPRVWEDLQTLFSSVRKSSTSSNSKTIKILQLSIASGCFLFLSQVLIYVAIAQVTTGMAIALFFIYPVISGLLSWFLFRDRPSGFRYAAIGAVFCGELLILGGASSISVGNVPLGSTTAILSGVAFAVYVILTRICASKLHPVSFTVINFATMLLLSLIGLMIPFPGELSLVLEPSQLLEVILCAFILGVLTLFGYVCNNVGIRQLGAPRSAIIGASVPFLTVIFAGLLIQENLEFVQILGVMLVTFGAAAFSFEKVRNQLNSNSQT